MTKRPNRVFSGCNNASVVVDPNTGKVVATIKNGTRVDALGWDPSKKLIFIPNGGELDEGVRRNAPGTADVRSCRGNTNSLGHFQVVCLLKRRPGLSFLRVALS
jgi:hypothetical protein